ncbi:MAG: iron complex outermembrane receptor protein [Alteromonadaceae bacterium]|jgi:iron complex outermembrane receptor protein
MNLTPSLLGSTLLCLLSSGLSAEVIEKPVDQSVNKTTKQSVEVITVSGDFQQQNLQKTPASVAVINQSMIQQRNAQHLEDVLNTAANIHFSAGASRARFFQIRGIGERSQFVDSVNPSVGITIDGIDYSGIGTVATLFDIDQVEIFRGPQGTRFGANAMAGMINLKGHEADGEQSGKVQLSYGNYNSQQIAAAHGAQISEGLSYRAAIQKRSSDGFINNRFLNRDDTNDTDELGGRLNLSWQASEQLKLNLAVHYFDLDNGYDAFSLDNNRTTLSDQPGFDKQRTRAFAINSQYSGYATADINLDVSHNNSDLAYGYDEDWTHTDFHPWEYSSFDHYFRDHQNSTIDLRFSAKAGTDSRWIVGIFAQQKDIDLQRLSVFGFAPLFTSRFDTHNTAIYGQRDWQLNDQLTLIGGLRLEQHEGDYDDSLATAEDVDDLMWGGKFSLSYQMTDDTLLYSTLSRGYKAGGVNGEAIAKALVDGEDTTTAFLQKRTTYDPEILHSIEFGLKSRALDNKLTLRLSAFYSDRKDVQLKGFVTEDVAAGTPGDVPVFVGYIENASSGKNYGFETELDYQVTSNLNLLATLGWLHTKVEDFVSQSGIVMDGRDQAHAPQYQYNVGFSYDINDHWIAHINAEGKDDFYFSMSHNAQSDSVNLVNMSLAYHQDNWDITFWGRNIFDEDYAVRGFEFGNDPRDGYETHTYTQLGEPGRYGATFRHHF